MDLININDIKTVTRDASEIIVSERWMKDFLRFNRMMGQCISGDDAPDIKIALLDTGIDALHPVIQSRWTIKHGKEERYQDFVGDGTEGPIDEDGHGTHCAGSILEAAPRALLYVARVCKNRLSCQRDKDLVKKVTHVSLWKRE